MPSPYQLTENSDYSYEFTTYQGIKYSVYFLDYNWVFHKYSHLAHHNYTFNIDVIEGNANKVYTDERIGVTVAEIFRLFFDNTQNVAIYICDSFDDRQSARKKKFDFGFRKYNDGSILKEDGVVNVENVEILNSILIHKQKS